MLILQSYLVWKKHIDENEQLTRSDGNMGGNH